MDIYLLTDDCRISSAVLKSTPGHCSSPEQSQLRSVQTTSDIKLLIKLELQTLQNQICAKDETLCRSGRKGSRGKRGRPRMRGRPGPPGRPGSEGPPRRHGPIGPIGLNGVNGDMWIQGDIGPAGPSGAPGEKDAKVARRLFV